MVVPGALALSCLEMAAKRPPASASTQARVPVALPCFVLAVQVKPIKAV